MANTRRATGLPSALARDGKAVPPSPDVAERTLAEVIGETVALHLGQLLADLVPQPAGCVICVQQRKAAEQAHAVAVANAARAAEPEPQEPGMPGIMPAITWIPLGAPGQQPQVLPVCYGHFESGPQVRPVGLVSPNGTPIVARS